MPDNFCGQARLGALQPVLHLDGGDVLVRPNLERQRDRQAAIVGALRIEVEQVLNAAEFLLDGRGNGLRHSLGVCAGIPRLYLHCGRCDFGGLLHRQAVQRHATAQHNHNRDDAGEDGAVYEEA